MHVISTRRLALVVMLAAGCTSSEKRPPTPTASAPPIVGRGSPAVPKVQPLPDKPISPARQVQDPDDRVLLIPPPPSAEEMAKPAVAKSADAKSAEPNSPILLARAEELVPTARVEDEGLTAIKRIRETAVSAYAKMDSFEARLTRRETMNGKNNPQETISFKFRKEPFSVRLKWLGQEGLGREVVYVQGKYGGKMHIMPSKHDAFPLPPMRMAFLPDDSTVRSKTRHDIRDAGLGSSIRQLGNILDLIAKNPAERQRLRYLGTVTRPEFVTKMHAIEESIPAKSESLLPQGGKRVYFFDTGADSPSLGLPVLVIAHDAANKEVEYYCFDRFLYPIHLGDADFDPEQVFKKK